MTLARRADLLDRVEQLIGSLTADTGHRLGELHDLRARADERDGLVQRSYERVQRSSQVETAAAAISVELVEQLQVLRERS